MIEIIAVAAAGMLSPADLGTKTSDIQQVTPIHQEIVAPHSPDEAKLGASMLATNCSTAQGWTIDDWRTWD